MPKIREWNPRRSESEQRRIERRARRGQPSNIPELRLVRDEARFCNRFLSRDDKNA